MPENLAIDLDGCLIKPEKAVKLLGVTLDRFLTFSPHISNVVEKCHRLLGALAKAAPGLPSNLLRMAYVALVRSHLEYASCVWASAATTHLDKLDIVQKIASRIITHSPSRAHSAPLLKQLNIDTLGCRREKRIVKVINNMIQGVCHPTFKDMFQLVGEGVVEVDAEEGRISVGKNLRTV